MSSKIVAAKKNPAVWHLMDLEPGSKCQVATIKSFGEMFEDFRAYEAVCELAGKHVSIQMQIGNIIYNSKNSGKKIAVIEEKEDFLVGYIDHTLENNPIYQKNVELCRVKREWLKDIHEEIVPLDVSRSVRLI